MPPIPEPDFEKYKRAAGWKPVDVSGASPYKDLTELEDVDDIPWVPASARPRPPVNPREFLGLSKEDARNVLLAYAARGRETLNIWKPNPIQEAFHRSYANIRLLLGGNRSGKSLSAIFEACRAVLGRDPYGKYPKKNGILVVVGKDETSLADVIWERLYKPGAFQIIRDLEEEERTDSIVDIWRAVLPNSPADVARKAEWRPAEPFLPHRLVGQENIVWGKAGRQVPAVVRIPSTGWEIRFFTGGSKPRAGFVADLVWIDEELEKDLWSREMRSRIVDRGGRFMWSATPENCSQSLYNLYERHLQGDKHVDVFSLDTSQNKYIDQDNWKLNSIDMTTEERNVKEKGMFKLGGQKIFTKFNWSVHSCEPFIIPRDWSRFISIDPGQVCATAILAAVPPDTDEKHGGRVYIYDEIIVLDASAVKLAEAIKARTSGDDFDAWVIDWHFARQKQTGTGLTIAQHYETAFKEAGLTTTQSGVNFDHAADGHEARNEAMKLWLTGDRPVLQIFSHCKVLRSQMEKYHFKRDGQTGLVTNKPVKLNDHAVDCATGLASFDPIYKKKNMRRSSGPVALALANKRKGTKKGGGVKLGPGGVGPRPKN